MKKICFFFFLLFSLQSFSQKVVLKNNLVYDALLTPNLSVEFSLGKKWTLDTQIGMNFFFYENDATANGYKTKKWSHWLVQPEIRYWTCETFNGWFLGLSCPWRADECGRHKYSFYYSKPLQRNERLPL